MSEVRLRFAPSPTGYLHIGGARTALFNWLQARKEGGKFILRIEDTDVARSTQESVDAILEGMRWLSLDWDEGPYFQSEQFPVYREHVEKLLAAGRAYRCYCAPEELEAKREQAMKDGRKPKYDGTCRNLAADLADRPHAVRFKAPQEGVTAFDDLIKGRISFSNDELDDLIIQRSDGTPTYNFTVVIDDATMDITTVIRGDDHINNTPRQILLYEALGHPVPRFAHVPMILGADKARLSKRHGATSVGSYRDEGFLPEAFRNFLALLGWSPGEDAQFLRTPEIVAHFSLEGVSRTNAVFDRAKLEWFNVEYLQKLPIGDLLPAVQGELERARLWQPEWAQEKREWFAKTVDLLRPRTRLLPDFSTWARAFFSDSFDYDQKAREKFWKDERLGAMLGKLADGLAQLREWNHDACERVLRELAAAEGVKAGLLINATRVAIVGQAVAPPLFETMLVLGQERVVRRLRRAVEVLAVR